jgi:hypothetical protein
MFHRVDLSSIDRSGFRLVAQAGAVLVQPLRTKHAWREDELPLRSMLTDREGEVRSIGWPKFFNHGESPAHDARFQRALAEGSVEFAEKLDGTLIIADRQGEGFTLRTRGQVSLGAYEAPVRALIAARYPGLPGLLADAAGPGADHSLLFEYVAPDNTVVIHYPEPALVFLGAVSKRTLAPRWDAALCELVARRGGVPAAPVHAMPQRLDEVVERVAAMKGKEGLVARCLTPEGEPLLIKLKAAEYLRLYGHRTMLGGRGALRLAFLLDLEDETAVPAAFARVGLDHEASVYALGALRPYFAARQRAAATLEGFRRTLASVPGGRREQIEQARALIAADPELADPSWFAVAIKLLEGRQDHAALIVASHLIGEPVPTLRSWARDREAVVAEMMATTAPREGD